MTPDQAKAAARAPRLLGHARAFIFDACGRQTDTPAPRSTGPWRDFARRHPLARQHIQRLVARTFRQGTLQARQAKPSSQTFAQTPRAARPLTVTRYRPPESAPAGSRPSSPTPCPPNLDYEPRPNVIVSRETLLDPGFDDA